MDNTPKYKRLGIYGYKTAEDVHKSGQLLRDQSDIGRFPKKSPVTGKIVPKEEQKIGYVTAIRRLNFLRLAVYRYFGGKENVPSDIMEAFNKEMSLLREQREREERPDKEVIDVDELEKKAKKARIRAERNLIRGIEPEREREKLEESGWDPDFLKGIFEVEETYYAEDDESSDEGKIGKEEATFAKDAKEEIERARKAIKRLPANVIQKIESEAVKLRPGKYPGSKKFDVKVTAEMIKLTGGTTEWDWEYLHTKDLGPPRRVYDPKLKRKKLKWPGKCDLCNHPVRFDWRFVQKKPPTGKEIGVGVVCAHKRLGVPVDILARAYALVQKLSREANTKTRNSELNARFSKFFDDVVAVDPKGVVTARRITQSKLFDNYKNTGNIVPLLGHIRNWMRRGKSTTLRLTKDMMDDIDALKKSPTFLSTLKKDVYDAERKELERRAKWRSIDPSQYPTNEALEKAIDDAWKREGLIVEAASLGINPAQYPTFDGLRKAINEEREKQKKERDAKWRADLEREAKRVGIDPSQGLMDMADALESAAKTKKMKHGIEVKKFLDNYADTNDYLKKMKSQMDHHPKGLSKGMTDAVLRIKKSYENELAKHPDEFAYALAHAKEWTMRDFIKKVSFGRSLSQDQIDTIKSHMPPPAPVTSTPATVTPGIRVPSTPKPSDLPWKDDEWDALQWIEVNKNLVKDHWFFSKSRKYRRSFIDSLNDFKRQKRSLTVPMRGMLMREVAHMKSTVGA